MVPPITVPNQLVTASTCTFVSFTVGALLLWTRSQGLIMRRSTCRSVRPLLTLHHHGRCFLSTIHRHSLLSISMNISKKCYQGPVSDLYAVFPLKLDQTQGQCLQGNGGWGDDQFLFACSKVGDTVHEDRTLMVNFLKDSLQLAVVCMNGCTILLDSECPFVPIKNVRFIYAIIVGLFDSILYFFGGN